MGLQICHIATPQDTRAILLQIDPRETRIQNNRRERLQWRNKANDRLPQPERCPENEHPRTIWRYCKKYLMDSHASLHPSQSRLTYLLPWLALIVFLAITYLPWKNEQQIVVKELQTGFDFRVRNAEYLVGQRIKIYEQVLNGVEGLFSHARVVKRNEFRNYVAKLNLMNDYPGIQGLGFALIVPKADKDRHIASIRKTASTATRPISRRNRSSIAGDGVSSTSFWWRRWIEQSRSPRCTTWPRWSATICTSMWRGSRK